MSQGQWHLTREVTLLTSESTDHTARRRGPQISGETRNVSHRIIFPMGKMESLSFHPEDRELEWLTAWDLCYLSAKLHQAPRTRTRVVARGSPKLPPSAPKVANSPDDLSIICMTKTRTVPQPLSWSREHMSRIHLLRRNDTTLSWVSVSQRFLVQRGRITPGNVFPNCTGLTYTGNSHQLSTPPHPHKSDLGFHSHLYMGFASLYDTAGTLSSYLSVTIKHCHPSSPQPQSSVTT